MENPHVCSKQSLKKTVTHSHAISTFKTQLLIKNRTTKMTLKHKKSQTSDTIFKVKIKLFFASNFLNGTKISTKDFPHI